MGTTHKLSSDGEPIVLVFLYILQVFELGLVNSAGRTSFVSQPVHPETRKLKQVDWQKILEALAEIQKSKNLKDFSLCNLK